MRRLLLTTGMLLLSCSACLAQVSTMGSTAMGLPTTPGTIVTSPLNGPGPFSATTQPGTSDTTLAPVPLASDPTTPGTVVTCSTPTGQIAPGTPAVPVTSMSAMGGTMGSMPSAIAPPTISAVPAASSASATGNGIAPYLTLSAQPATSFMTDFPGTTIPAPPLPATPAPPPPSITVPSAPPPSTMSSAVSTSMMGGTPAMPASTTATSRALGTIPTPFVGSTTGTIPSAPPVGGASTIVCSSMPGGPPTNGAALPLSTPDVPAESITRCDPAGRDAACHHQPRPDDARGANAEYLGLRREHVDGFGQPRDDGTGQCHGCDGNSRRFASAGLLMRGRAGTRLSPCLRYDLLPMCPVSLSQTLSGW